MQLSLWTGLMWAKYCRSKSDQHFTYTCICNLLLLLNILLKAIINCMKLSIYWNIILFWYVCGGGCVGVGAHACKAHICMHLHAYFVLDIYYLLNYISIRWVRWFIFVDQHIFIMIILSKLSKQKTWKVHKISFIKETDLQKTVEKLKKNHHDRAFL